MKKNKIEIPKDLGIKIKDPHEAKWIQIKESAENALVQNHIEIELNEIMLKVAKEKISLFEEKDSSYIQ